jgi:hypothetical protein
MFASLLSGRLLPSEPAVHHIASVGHRLGTPFEGLKGTMMMHETSPLPSESASRSVISVTSLSVVRRTSSPSSNQSQSRPRQMDNAASK